MYCTKGATRLEGDHPEKQFSPHARFSEQPQRKQDPLVYSAGAGSGNHAQVCLKTNEGGTNVSSQFRDLIFRRQLAHNMDAYCAGALLIVSIHLPAVFRAVHGLRRSLRNRWSGPYYCAGTANLQSAWWAPPMDAHNTGLFRAFGIDRHPALRSGKWIRAIF